MLDRYDQDLLLDYLEGELDAGRRVQLDAMLAEDPELAALLHEMARDRDALRSLAQAEAPSDLVHDVTNTLERRMLLDDAVDETAPIPLSRGRALAGEPTRSISWGRVVGLTGLAASVALAAGILVITFDDTLERTANEFAASTPADTEEVDEESAVVDDAIDETVAEGIAARVQPDHTDGAPGIVPKLATDPPADLLAGIDNAHGRTPAAPEATPDLGPIADSAGGQPTETLALRSTAAISAIQPRQQLVLFSESPEVSLEQLIEFCVANGIPVVEPDQQARVAENRDLQFNPDPGLAEDVNEDTQADEPIADYALLINETQLDKLVQDLNDNVAIDPSKLGKGSLISNQAALLADLPEAAYRSDPVDQDVNRANVKDVAAGSEQQNTFTAQQAIQLNSPDLGSPYANTRNAYNLQTQQQAGYSQPLAPLTATRDSEGARASVGGNSGVATAPQPEAELAAPNSVDRESDKSLAEADRVDSAKEKLKDDAAEQKAQDKIEATRRKRSIDPTRGNWLSAHLPVADTTPLLLDRRANHTDQPTKLVPVMIQRAEPDKVNTLRLRQQVEYANRGNRAVTEAEGGAKEAAEVTDSERAEEAEPAEAESAEPSE